MTTAAMTLGTPAKTGGFFGASPVARRHHALQHQIPDDLDLQGGSVTQIEETLVPPAGSSFVKTAAGRFETSGRKTKSEETFRLFEPPAGKAASFRFRSTSVRPLERSPFTSRRLQSEEIDPVDNCTIHITRYTIRSADGEEESVLTKKRKMRVNCTQSTKRIEFVNGKQSNVEEKTTVLGTLDMGGRHPIGGFMALADCPEEAQFNEVLAKTQNTFMSLLHQKKDELVTMFPDLFTHLRTEPEIFGTPTTITQEIVNPDGTTTIKTKSSKAFSSRFVREATYINGNLSQSKCKFRAFMEYAGPEGGFRIKLNDRPDEDLSEDECETDEDSNSLMSSLSFPPPRSHSEITNFSSAMIAHSQPTQVPQIVSGSAPLPRSEKAWHAVNELVESEVRYVQKLGLLEKFRLQVEQEKMFDKKTIVMLFSNLASLYAFHNDHLLPQLMDRRRDWQATKKISDVLRKQGPFLKMYSEYTNNYKTATATFEKCREKRRFDEIVRKLEKLPECENLSLITHLICPVQRVMRYQLLLKEYLKHLHQNDGDYQDTTIALNLVVEAAGHANEMMRKLDRYRNVLEAQEQLGNSIALVSPSRELLRRVKLMKISSTTNRVEERVLFVFNDLILLASERTIGIGGKYRLRAIFDPFYTQASPPHSFHQPSCLVQICEGDNLEREFSFYLRGSDSPNGPSRCVELYCANQNEKADLIDTIWAIINEVHQRKSSISTSPSVRHLVPCFFSSRCLQIQSITSPSNERKACASCDAEFNWLRTGTQCSLCQKRYCKKCIGAFREQKQRRFCNDCINAGTVNVGFKGGPSRQNLLALPAIDDDIIKASDVQLKSSNGRPLHRYFTLRKNFALYSYNNQNDELALCMLPISGCEITPSNEKLAFNIRHMHRSYHITVFNEDDYAEWMAALILCANAELPGRKSK
ncbi:hypothetical protein M3Y99_01493100 [Aphelenchoides fujianensis]|nr:hypothetical protein M3Y99_01493100 [Aphelenchoides fujianensis]